MRHMFREIREIREDKGESSLPYIVPNGTGLSPDQIAELDRPILQVRAITITTNDIVNLYEDTTSDVEKEHIKMYAQLIHAEATMHANDAEPKPLSSIAWNLGDDYEHGKISIRVKNSYEYLLKMLNQVSNPKFRASDARKLLDKIGAKALV